MLKPLTTYLIQHILAQNTWAMMSLKPFSGQSVQFHIGSFSTALIILENGQLAITGETSAKTANATINITPGTLLRMLVNDDGAKSQINIEGDTHLAAEFSKMLHDITWDFEEDLSHLTGDIVAHKMATWGRSAFTGLKKQSVNVAGMVTEYWQEELPLIAKKRHIAQFNTDVDDLRAAIERTEKRLSKLIAQP